MLAGSLLASCWVLTPCTWFMSHPSWESSSSHHFIIINCCGLKIPRALKCDLIWKWGLCRHSQVKVRHLSGPQFSMPGVFIKKRKLGHTHKENTTLPWRAEVGGMKQKPRIAKDGQQTSSSQGTGMDRTHPASQPSARTSPANALISDFWPPELWDPKFLLLKPPGPW